MAPIRGDDTVPPSLTGGVSRIMENRIFCLQGEINVLSRGYATYISNT